jgi:hypothetical protein
MQPRIMNDLCGNQPVMAPSSGEEPVPSRHRAGIASMACREIDFYTVNERVALAGVHARRQHHPRSFPHRRRISRQEVRDRE